MSKEYNEMLIGPADHVSKGAAEYMGRCGKCGECHHPDWVCAKKSVGEIAATLKERGNRYGDFADNARVHQELLSIINHSPGSAKLECIHLSALDVICQKIARIVNGDPNYKDNWHDIQGYAKLVEERLP